MNERPEVSNAPLRQMIRTRLAAGSLFPVDAKVFAGKGTGQRCIVCGMPIFATEMEHEVTEPQRAYAHMTCHSLWVQESKSLSESRQMSPFSDTAGVIHIVRRDRRIVQPTTTVFSVSFGGHKDGVGTIELGKPKGFDALTALLQKLSVPPSEIEIACQVLTAEPHHEIPNVILRRGIFRQLGLADTD